MLSHILIPTDGSDFANQAVERGAELAKKLGAKLTIVMVTPPWTAAAPAEVAIAIPTEQYEANLAQHAKDELERATGIAKDKGLTCDVIHVPDRYPADGILDAVKSSGADGIVIASHGRRGITKLLLGSTAQEVVTRSDVPVVVIKN